MSKVTKKIIKYRNSVLPQNLEEILSNADENDLRILIALMMAADENGEVSDKISLSDALGMDKTTINASIKFWRGAGMIIEASGNAALHKAEKTAVSAEKPAVETAHRDGAVEQNSGVNNYMTVELATILEQRQVTVEFVEEAQRVFGKTFNSYDTGIVVGLVDQLGFDEEAVLAILAYATRLGKRGVRYCEKLALALYDDGYTHTKEVLDRIEVIERSTQIIFKVRQLFGIGDRSLSKNEREMFERWTQKYEYDIDVIKFAYDIMIDTIQKPVPKYVNTILEKWHNEGLKTLEDVTEYEKRQKESKARNEAEQKVEKSYDLDGFFEAALQRSFNDLK